MNQKTPIFHPLTEMPMIAEVIDGMLQDSKEQLETLEPCRNKPHVLDDYTVDRVTKLYTERAEFIDVYQQQLTRWRKQNPSSTQKLEIARLYKTVREMKELNDYILNLAAELKKGTIDRIMEKSDGELALEVLSGKMKL